MTAFAGHFVLAQLTPQELNDYDDLLAAQLQDVGLEEARMAATLAEGLSTSLLQNRSLYPHAKMHFLAPSLS